MKNLKNRLHSGATFCLIVSSALLGGCASVAPYISNDESWQVPPAHQPLPKFDYTAHNHKAHHNVTHFRREGGHEYVVWRRSGAVPVLTTEQIADNIARTQNLQNPDHVKMETVPITPVRGALAHSGLETAGMALLWQKYCNQEKLTDEELELLSQSAPPEFLYETCAGLK